MTRKPAYSELLDAFHDQELLIEIGRDLMRERDTDRLLRRILEVSRFITGADAGSIFLAEGSDANPLLRFKYTHTASMPLPYEEFTMTRSTNSIAGYVSLTGETLNIPNVYDLDPSLPFGFNNSFDLAHGYITKSMLSVPMNNHEGTIVGVIQLINSKEKNTGHLENPDEIKLKTTEDFREMVVPFKERYVPLMESIAAQAAIALENAAMIKRIRNQFEQFVVASVEAVEDRDPPTSGHSRRVAELSVRIGRRLNQLQENYNQAPVFTETQLKELEFAALLHDFGKLYIDPGIFLKAKKLYPQDMDMLKLRLRYLRRSMELDFALRSSGLDTQALDALNKEREKTIAELAEISETIEKLNEPTLTAIPPGELIQKILESPVPSVLGVENEKIPLLTEQEIYNLQIPKGSLNDTERREIEQHVIRSYEFVKRIPWPPEFEKIPVYIRCHHEMLDGSGYPDGLKKEQIPVQGRILAVADIFDALTATDRPYKKAVPVPKALAILQEEAERGRLDGELVAVLENLA